MRPYAEKIEEMIIDIASNISVRGNLSEKFPLLTGKRKGTLSFNSSYFF